MAMITKRVYPEFVGDKVVKMIAEYRLFGILLCKKIWMTPFFYGKKEWDGWITNL